MRALRSILAIALLTAVQSSVASETSSQSLRQADPDAKAIHYLSREIPAWYKGNGCFSCHNNGDGARALFLAESKGHKLSPDALADTRDWLSRPSAWDDNKGERGFSDKNLADLQFTASLANAIEYGQISGPQLLEQAAERLLKSQSPDGSWRIEPANVLGSPTTWGTPLATLMAMRSLRSVRSESSRQAIARAGAWLGTLQPTSSLNAATLLLAFEDGAPVAAQARTDSLKLIESTQTSDGGWGPYAASPPEPFDTAIVLIAIASARDRSLHQSRIKAARRFLFAEQELDGSWAATTRPRGSESYAQKISTTAWVTISLLLSR